MTTVIEPNAVTVTFEDTGREVPYVTLLAWKAAIRLETVGLRRSGRSASAIAKEYMGLPRNMKKADVLQIVEDIIEDVKSAPEVF